MNWLAHIYLSEPTAAFRIGNLLPDLVRVDAACLAALPREIQRGVERHRRIDAFTDAHPVVRRSVCRFEPPYRRYAGILTDVFYDHFLSREWAAFCPVPLTEFVEEFFNGVDTHRADVPAAACQQLDHIRHRNWLCCYGELAGLGDVLRRMGRRFRRPFDLELAMTTFEEQYEEFRADFREFFPELRAEVMEDVMQAAP